MEDKKHAALPWKILDLKPEPQAISIGGSENTGAIATMWGRFALGDERQANAEFIVRACNSHYQLLELIKDHLALSNWDGTSHEELEKIAAKYGFKENYNLSDVILKVVIEIHEAIAEAEGNHE